MSFKSRNSFHKNKLPGDINNFLNQAANIPPPNQKFRQIRQGVYGIRSNIHYTIIQTEITTLNKWTTYRDTFESSFIMNHHISKMKWPFYYDGNLILLTSTRGEIVFGLESENCQSKDDTASDSNGYDDSINLIRKKNYFLLNFKLLKFKTFLRRTPFKIEVWIENLQNVKNR